MKADKKQETDTEMLARLMVEGFGQVNHRLDGIDDRLDGMDSRIGNLETGMVEVKDRLLSLEKGQTDIYRCLDAMEKKQGGLLISVDDTVSRGEFMKLARRVEALEA